MFMNCCPTPGANWKNPTGHFGIGTPTVLSTELPFQARSSGHSPWAHKSEGSLSSTSITHEKLLLCGDCPSRPQLKDSDIPACVNLVKKKTRGISYKS
jgi:hypothetical protein